MTLFGHDHRIEERLFGWSPDRPELLEAALAFGRAREQGAADASAGEEPS